MGHHLAHAETAPGRESYRPYANRYFTKPVDREQFNEVRLTMTQYWFAIVERPSSLPG